MNTPSKPATPIEQLEAWKDDPEKEIFVSAATPSFPLAVTYRGILKWNPRGYYYIKADELLSPVRGIAINVGMIHPDVKLAFEFDGEGDRYIAVKGTTNEGTPYRIVIADKDGFAHPKAIHG